MQRLIINGGKRLCGEIRVQGAKNSALPLLAGCLLAEGRTVLRRCPELTDVFAACRILNELGCKCSFRKDTAVTDPVGADGYRITEELMREMRSSIVFLGAVLGKTGRCELSYPGGCELGPRPIDMHLTALKQLGVRICEEHGRISCTCPKGIRGAVIDLPFPSVGATENVMLAAACAEGDTVIRNAAREPEIADLADFLNRCGADIRGAGCSTLRICGVKKLHGCEYEVMPDRIAAATYMAAAASTGGELGLIGIKCDDVQAVTAVFEVMYANTAIRSLIREGKTHQIDATIRSGASEGMIAMDESIYDLFKKGKITKETAVQYCNNPDAMERRLNATVGF